MSRRARNPGRGRAECLFSVSPAPTGTGTASRHRRHAVRHSRADLAMSALPHPQHSRHRRGHSPVALNATFAASNCCWQLLHAAAENGMSKRTCGGGGAHCLGCGRRCCGRYLVAAGHPCQHVTPDLSDQVSAVALLLYNCTVKLTAAIRTAVIGAVPPAA